MSKARVLFVDDELNVLSAISEACIVDVHTDESGKTALRLIDESEPFSVIVSDCRMPEMDGIELLQKVRKASRRPSRDADGQRRPGDGSEGGQHGGRFQIPEQTVRRRVVEARPDARGAAVRAGDSGEGVARARR